MNCPRCHAALAAAPDETGFVICASCGARLKRAAAGSRVPVAAAVAGRAAPAPASPATVEPRAAEIDSILARLEPIRNPAATLPPGTPLKPIPRPESSESPRPIADALELLVSEMRALRRFQEQILALLQARPEPSPGPLGERDFGMAGDESDMDDPLPAPSPPVRSRRRKTVLVIDDDESALKLVGEVLERAEIPWRVARDGGTGLAMIAQDKPDIIVLELGVAGVMSGKDVINMIKATMEWVDIPIVLYTRLAVASQKEARTVHGADEYVPKDAANAADTLVAKVITLFRKG
jgi:CheY-like chemotaxis protein